MKTLYLIRHAKSSWNHNLQDHDRPLNTRGFNDADLIGKILAKQNINIDKIYSSTANRAATTARIICEELNINLSEISYESTLYEFDYRYVYDFIKQIPDTYNSVLIFGHNTAFTDLVNKLGDRAISNLPTSGVVAIRFETEQWGVVGYGHTEKCFFPKDFK